MMKLSISNIAWPAEWDEEIYRHMQSLGFTGLEIAPTRIFPEQPYGDLNRAFVWAEEVHTRFEIPSMQSIWYGRTERIFGTEEERKALLDYSLGAIRFAAAIGCRNLVFGCPKNRSTDADSDPNTGLAFFGSLSDMAAKEGVVIGMEANPPIYNTNFLNRTEEALDYIDRISSPGMKLNLDLGTMIANEEDVSVLYGQTDKISHVHISEPRLAKITPRPLHKEVLRLLKESGYEGYVSIEMGKQESPEDVYSVLAYVRDLVDRL